MLSLSLNVAWVRACIYVCNTQVDFESNVDRKLPRSIRSLLHEKKEHGEESRVEPTAVVIYVKQTDMLHGIFALNGLRLQQRFDCLPVRASAADSIASLWPSAPTTSRLLTLAEMRTILALFRLTPKSFLKRESRNSSLDTLKTSRWHSLMARPPLQIIDDGDGRESIIKKNNIF